MIRRGTHSVQILLVTLVILACGRAHAESEGLQASPPAQQLESQELIVLLADSPGTPTPEEVVDRARRGLDLPRGLGVGGPQKVDFLLRRRAQGRLRKQLLADSGSPRAQLERTIVLRYPTIVNLDAIEAALKHNPHVLNVERNRIYQLAVTPSDPLFSQTTSPYGHQWGSHLLRFPEAWDYTKGNAYVGIIDTGIDTDHEDLQAFRFQNGSWVYQGGNFRPQFSRDYTYQDSDVDEGQPQFESGALRTVTAGGHGTHVAGIVAATADNGLGVAGVCWHCSLMIARANYLEEDNGQWYQGRMLENAIVEALTELTDRGGQLINMSFGRTDNFPNCNNQNHHYCNALAHAHKHDLILVAASGNKGTASVDFPAAHPDVIATGGVIPVVEANGVITGAFWNACNPNLDTSDCPSNYGSDQELVAPARQVLSTFYLGLPYAGTGCDDSMGAGGLGYGPCTGTSMASPYVTGAAALVRSVNPLLTGENVRNLLTSKASNNGTRDFVAGYGIPNVFASVQGALGQAGGTVLSNRLTPLFSLYSSYAEDHFYTTIPQMAAAEILGLDVYSPVGPATPGYTLYPGTQCQISPCFDATPTASVYIFTGDRAPFAGAPPLVPLYRLSFKGSNPNGNPNHRDTNYTTELAGIDVFHDIGYEVDGIEGYIYQKCTPEPSCMPAGTVRLYRRYHPGLDDFAIFPESELAQMVAQGYTSTGGSNLNEVLGYVYANADSDGDTLIDGFERLTGTNIASADSDCDGASDGTEVLNYPYGDPLSSPGCSPANAAMFLSQNVPATMAAGRIYWVSITLKNVGTQAWSPVGPQCNAYMLHSANPDNNTTWGRLRAELPAPVAPGGQVTLNFQVVAPMTSGVYNFQWSMVQECVEWFGDVTPNVPVTVQAAPPKDAQILSQSVPSTMVAGQSYAVSATLRNVGTLSWSPVGPQCNAYRWGSLNNNWNPTRAELPAVVAPGLQVMLNFSVTAPMTPGTYPFQWRMVHECVEWFGDSSPSIAVSVVAPPPPVANFSFVCTGLSCSFNGAGSTGTGITHSWSFGDSTSGSGTNPNHLYGATGAYTATLTVSDPWGQQSSKSRKVSASSEVPPQLSYFTLPQCRLVDTRTTSSPLTSGQAQVFNVVAGSCGIPATAKAVSFNVTVLSSTGGGYLVFYPGNQSPGPFVNAATNFNPSIPARANNAVLRLATDGTGTLAVLPTIFASPGQAHLVLDIEGYFSDAASPAPGAQGPFGFQSITPCRLVDTRTTNNPIPAGGTASFTVQSQCGIPAGASAAALNLAVITPTGGGYATAFPAGIPRPPVSSINFVTGTPSLVNGVRNSLAATVPDLSVFYFSSAGATTHVVLDAFGYFGAGALLKYRPVIPCRAFDTRFAEQGAPALSAGETRNIQIQGNCGVPVGARAALVNLSVIAPSSSGYLTAFASGTPRPLTAALNFHANQGTIVNGVIAPLSTNHEDLSIFVPFSSANIVVDVFGYFQ